MFPGHPSLPPLHKAVATGHALFVSYAHVVYTLRVHMALHVMPASSCQHGV